MFYKLVFFLLYLLLAFKTVIALSNFVVTCKTQ